jgi:glyoxylase-like metal-dependent hydrolase (beta-lactamase superfamily II)
MSSDLFLPATAADSLIMSTIRGLHVTPASPLPFLASVMVRSFVLEREPGNLILYNSPGITAARRDIENLGLPDKLLITHWHEGLLPAPEIDVPIFVHEKDRAQTNLPVAGTFSERQVLNGDLEIIPAPGHTAGNVMFLWDNGTHRLLFPGDSVWVQGGEWKAVLLAEGDRDAYVATLSHLMQLDFDFLVPWGTQANEPYAYHVGPGDAWRKLGAIADRLKAGQNA